jgi:hypothetical protein
MYYLSKQCDNNNNNYVVVEENFQRRSFNVCCGVFGDRLVGPFFVDSSHDQTKYHITYLLSKEISNFLGEMPLAVLNRVVFQDGAIPHNAHMNVVFLNHLNKFGDG